MREAALSLAFPLQRTVSHVLIEIPRRQVRLTVALIPHMVYFLHCAIIGFILQTLHVFLLPLNRAGCNEIYASVQDDKVLFLFV